MPDMIDNGRVVEIDDPAVGRSTQVGPLALLESSAMTIGRPSPGLGQHQSRLGSGTCPPASPSRQATKAPVQLAPPPLQGITILEAAYFIAGPLASTILAELGARVIKLEPLEGDPFRRTTLESAQLSHGKESLAVDLKHQRARDLVDRLVKKSDVLLHSFRPGAPERPGLDYSRVHRLNPAMVYLYAGSYGSKGPQSQRPAFHSTPNALCGAGIVQAGQDNPPVDDSYPDPCSGLGVATAIAIGLHAREQTGMGQPMETTMLTATGYVQSDMVVQYPGRPAIGVPDRGQHGFHALYRLYECASGWIFLAAVQEKEWGALTGAVGRPEWLSDSRYSRAQTRDDNDHTLAEALSEIFASKPADEWQSHLLAHAVPVTRADEQTFGEFLVDNVPHRPMTHPDFGDYWRRASTIRFSGCEAIETSVAPSLGEHTAAILAELGYSPEERQETIDSGAVRA